MPDPAFIPLLPKHVHALAAARGPDRPEFIDLFRLPEFER